jgi:hypothetical protein
VLCNLLFSHWKKKATWHLTTFFRLKTGHSRLSSSPLAASWGRRRRRRGRILDQVLLRFYFTVLVLYFVFKCLCLACSVWAEAVYIPSFLLSSWPRSRRWWHLWYS